MAMIRTYAYFRITRSRIPNASCCQSFRSSSSSAPYPFPEQSNPSPYEIFHLSQDSTPTDIKRRYFELVRIYHPDTASAQGIPLDIAEERFYAITKAYNALQQRTGSLGTLEAFDSEAFDSEAEEIKKRLATWAAADARRSHSAYDKERRERALRAESMVGGWWRSDLTLYYLLGGAALAVAFMHIQGRSPATQREKMRKYLEIKRKSDSKSLEP